MTSPGGSPNYSSGAHAVPSVSGSGSSVTYSSSSAPAAATSSGLAAEVQTLERAIFEVKRIIVGQDQLVERILVGLLAKGHVLLEGVPGVAKTLAVETFAKVVGGSFARIQFTPDLLPSDITGVSVFDADTSTFSFRRGPIFAYVVLGDEINRTSPKVQSAMLEAMAEKQVTVDNVSYQLDDFFFVMATQNPQDLAGTYPLPVAQLDRFLFKIRMEYIDRESEIEVLRTRLERLQPPGEDLPRIHRAEVIEARHLIEQEVHASPAVLACLVDIAREIRANPHVAQGISTRSLVMAVPALKARALARGRGFISGEDVEALAPYIFSHRVSLAVPTANTVAIVKEALARPLEALSRATLHA